MKKKNVHGFLPGILTPIAVAAILLFFLSSVSNLADGHSREEQQQLEDVLHRAAVACYAVEGFYPPDVAYMTENYGLRYDADAYMIHYTIFASNLMPDITVVERNP